MYSLFQQHTPIELLVDNDDQRNDVLIYIFDLVQKYETREVSWDDLEAKVENEFELPKGSLSNKLRKLEVHLNQSIKIHEEAMERERKREPSVDKMVKDIPVIKTGKDDLKQDSGSLNIIYTDAQFVTDELGKVLFEKFGSRALIAELKDRIKAEKKIKNKYSGDVTKVRDISRFTVIAKSISQLINDLTEILRLKNCKVLNLKNKFLTPNALGYRDVNLNISYQLPDGRTHICEVQLHLQGIIDVKEATHC